MMTDPIADMLTRMRNALARNFETVEMPASKEREGIADVLMREGYIRDYKVVSDGGHPLLKLYLKYGPVGKKVVRKIERVSTPGRRFYSSVADLGFVANGMGISIISTSQGILSDRECRARNVGGEVICQIE